MSTTKIHFDAKIAKKKKYFFLFLNYNLIWCCSSHQVHIYVDSHGCETIRFYYLFMDN